MSGTVLASNGIALPVDNLPQTLTYSGSLVATITVVYRGVTYIKTYTNNGTNITAISQWVAQ